MPSVPSQKCQLASLREYKLVLKILGISQYKIPNVRKPFQPSAPTCTCATVQSVKWLMAFTFFNESIGPSKVAMPYAVMATTRNLSTTSSRTLSQAPRKVSKPLIMPPHEGAMSITEKTTPSDCAQSGKAV